MPETPTRLADFLPYQMSVTTNAVSDLIAAEYRESYDLKIPEWRVMAVLGDAGPRTQRELVQATRMDKVAVNRAAKSLEERGLVSRNPNMRDGRSHHLELSAAGRDIHAQIMPHALDMEERLFAIFDAGERAQFKAMLQRILDAAGQLETGERS